MRVGANDHIPLACVPSAIASNERAAHFALIATLFGKLVQERAELPNGYAYRFAADALEQVARFVANERKCCPFLTFELAVIAGCGPLWLRMFGPQGTRAVLDAELATISPLAGLIAMPISEPTISGQAIRSGGIERGDYFARHGKLAAAGGLLGALGVVATSCLLPLVLASFGVGGVWVANVTTLAPYKPVLAVATAGFLAYGYYCVYWKSKQACAPAAACSPLRSNLAKVGLWIGAVLFTVGFMFDSHIEPLLR